MRLDLAKIATEQPNVVDAGQELIQSVLARSATDRAFRERLVATPRAALAEFLGKPESELPDVNVAFVENTGDATIVLPDVVDTNAELSETELEAVAGGSEPVSTTIIACAVGGVLLGAAIGAGAYLLGKNSD